jgi:hypothetical protein
MLLMPCSLGEFFHALGGHVIEFDLQSKEAAPGAPTPDSRAGGRVGGRRTVGLLLADAEYGCCLVLAHAEKSVAPDLPDRAPDVVGGGHARNLPAGDGGIPRHR